MPSRRHELLARVLPKLKRAQEAESPAAERAKIESQHRDLPDRLPTRMVPRFSRRWVVERDDSCGFATYTLTPRRGNPDRTLMHVPGGGFVSPIDPGHVRYATRLATAINARVVLPTYPLAPEHTWRDSHHELVERAADWADRPGGLVLSGDSAGGGLALAMALGLRDRAGAMPTHLLLHAPWVDLTTSTPETAAFNDVDPWLMMSKLKMYADWWAGRPEDLGRPEVSPALADLSGLPKALMFYGTRDLLAPGCRLLTRRATEAGWDLTSVEREGLLHVYTLMPFIPEAREGFAHTVAFLGCR